MLAGVFLVKLPLDLSIGSGNGLVLPGKKPLRELLLTQICVTIWDIRPQCLGTVRFKLNGWYFTDIIFKWILLRENFYTLNQISWKFVPKVLIHDRSPLVQILFSADRVMTIIIDIDADVQTGFNTLRPRQNGCHFPDNIFKCIFLNENVWILFLKVQLTIFQHWFR